MKKRHTLIALGGGAAVAVVIATGASGANPPRNPARPTKIGAPVPLPVRADDTTAFTVWRNGAYHTVVVPLKRKIQKMSDGGSQEIVSPADDTNAAIEAKLPPVDHSLDAVQPTAAQAAAVAPGAGVPMPPVPANAGTAHMLPPGTPSP